MVPVTLITFPRRDRVFARQARAVVDEALQSRAEHDGELNPEEIARRVRKVYPRTMIRARAALGGYDREPVWYVYRDGSPLSRDAGKWWQAAGAAQGTFKDGGEYVAASDELCELHGLPAGGLVGRMWHEFATPEAVAEADVLWRSMVEQGWPATGDDIQSTFTLVRADGLLQPIEYRTHPLPDGTFQTWFRPLGEPEPPQPDS